MIAKILLFPLFKTRNERIADMPFLQFGTVSPGVYRVSILGLINSFRIWMGLVPYTVEVSHR